MVSLEMPTYKDDDFMLSDCLGLANDNYANHCQEGTAPRKGSGSGEKEFLEKNEQNRKAELHGMWLDNCEWSHRFGKNER